MSGKTAAERRLTGAEDLTAVELAVGERLQVVTTTSLLADVVAQVGGEQVDLTQLLPTGTDPHSFTPSAGDLRTVAEADVVIVNGFGLEGQLLQDLEASAPSVPRVALSQGIEPLSLVTAEFGELEADHSPDGGADPHVWFDPRSVESWTETAAEALGALDPAGGAGYRAGAEAYRAELEALDAWIQMEVAGISPEDRELVTDHFALAYFAERYDFEVVGALIPAYSSQAEASAQGIAELQDLVAEREVRALFVGIEANPTLTDRLAEDLGIPVVPLYIGALSEPGGAAASYLELMRYDVQAIVEALS